MSETQELGRFGHHPDPAIDFCVEVEEIEAIWTDRALQFPNPDDAVLKERIGCAMAFRVGGDLHAINAKDRLRKIDDDMVEGEMERQDRIRNAAFDMLDVLLLIKRHGHLANIPIHSFNPGPRSESKDVFCFPRLICADLDAVLSKVRAS